MISDFTIIPVILLLALAVWLERRRRSDSAEAELKRVRVLVGALGASVVILGVASILNSMATRLLRVEVNELATQLAMKNTPQGQQPPR